MLPTTTITRRFTTLLGALLLLLLAAAPGANAADYWVSLSSSRGEIASGVNGFVWQSTGGPWSMWGSHCEAQPGSYVAGAYCRLRFNVPAGLTAGAIGNGGIARGDFRTANAFFILRSERPGGNPAGVTDSDGDGAFNHGWQVLGPYVDVGLRVSSATTTTSVTNWFHINTFDVVLHDPTAPVIQHVQAGNGGWNGPGCLPHSYSWADAGSQVNAMSITDLQTGAQVDGWGAGATGVTSGYAVATDYGCTNAPGTGTFAYRTTAVDRAGNAATYDYSLTFDTTRPTIGAPTLDGAPLEDGAVIDSRHGYRPAVTWRGVGDAHSGLASVSVTLDGAPIAFTHVGDALTLTAPSYLPLGSHELRASATDAVGNSTSVARTIVVRDDVAPLLSVASPAASGGSEPVLDVSASDDHAGLDPTTWTVQVNGATLVAASGTHRLQANIGYLVDGTHRIVVSVADRSGNVAERVIEYHADSGDELPDPPSLDGIFVFDSPGDVQSGSTHHVRALVVKAGRPVAGTVELRSGQLVLAAGALAANGSIDLVATISVPGPLTLHPPAGSGLSPATIEYSFHEPQPEPVDDGGHDGGGGDDGAGGGAGGGASGSGTGTTTNNYTTINNPPAPAPAQPVAAAAAAPTSAASGPYPRNVVYYVGNVPYWNGLPLAESGAPLDRVAPSWRMMLVQHRAGTVRRARRIAFRLWTTEMAVMSFQPVGSVRRTTISPRRQARTAFVTIARGSALDRRFQRARPGTIVTVRIRVVATDKNENRSFPKVLTFRVRA
jgi:hypothetical protein